jgi:glycosyltransferase involved in cell wall biosynthesis
MLAYVCSYLVRGIRKSCLKVCIAVCTVIFEKARSPFRNAACKWKCYKAGNTAENEKRENLTGAGMRKILLLPVFRFGSGFNSITVRTLEIYSRINGINFNFMINVDSESYRYADDYFISKLESLKVVTGSAGGSIRSLLKGYGNTLKAANNSDLLLNCSEYYLSLIYSYILHLLTGKKLICLVNIIHSGMRKKRSFELFVCSFVFRRCYGILLLNNASLIREFSDRFKTKGNISLTTNGVSVGDFYFSPEKTNDLLYIGIAEERKGAFDLPEIVERIRNSIPEVSMKILTRSGDINKLRRLINEKNLTENIEIISDYITERRKRELLATSKVFVFPSREEGIAIVIAEALASSLPVVLYNVESLKIFSSGTLKVEPGDIDAYAYTIKMLLEDDKLRLLTGMEGRQFAVEHLSYDKVAVMENEAIKNILS